MASEPHVILTSDYARAVQFATEIHASHTRKGKATAYVCHVLGVSALVLEAEGTQIEAIAGLLHDAAEDCGGESMLAEISDRFGAEVSRIVRGCSDSLTEDCGAKLDWRVRKEGHLAHLEAADASIALVTAADKLHNARAIVTDVQIHGVGTLERFHASPSEIVWYYESMLSVLQRKRVSPILLAPLTQGVRSLALSVSGSARPTE